MKDDLSYGHEPSPKFLRYMITQVNRLIARPLEDEHVGDILLMRYTKEPTHVAVQTHEGIVHAYAPMRKVVKMPFADSLRAIVVGRFRYPWQS